MNGKTEEETVDAEVIEHEQLGEQALVETGETGFQPPADYQPPSNLATMSPMQQMVEAKKMGMSMAEMKEMFELQKDYEANEARKAFHAALSKFKKDPPQIIKDLVNMKYGSSYSSIGNTVNTANEKMAPWGLNARWEYPPIDNGVIFVTCILAHELGHEEKVTLTGKPDNSGSKNPLQEAKSTRTYLKLETFEAVTGIASIAGNVDDDGNSAGQAAGIKVISEDQALTIDSKITDNDLNREVFTKWLSKFFPYTQGNPDKLSEDHYAKVIAKLDETIKNKSKQDNE